MRPKTAVCGIWIIGLCVLTILSCQDGESTWRIHWKNGEQFFQERNFSQAEKEFIEALKEAEKFGETDSRLPQTLTRLAAVYDAQSQWTLAQPLLERALAINEQQQGPDNFDLVASLRNLGAVHHVQHQFDQAYPLFQRALWLDEGQLGPDHPEVVKDLMNLVGLQVSQILYQEAGPFLTRTLSATESGEGEAEAAPSQDHDDFAKLYTAQQQYKMARPYLEQAIDRDSKNWDFHNIWTIGSVYNVAHVLSTPDKMGKAETILQQEVQAVEKEDGPTEQELRQNLTTLALFYRVQHRFDDAMAVLKKQLQIIEKIDGTKDTEMVDALTDLGILHQLKKHPEDAARLYKQALEVGEATLGKENPSVKRVRQLSERQSREMSENEDGRAIAS